MAHPSLELIAALGRRWARVPAAEVPGSKAKDADGRPVEPFAATGADGSLLGYLAILRVVGWPSVASVEWLEARPSGQGRGRGPQILDALCAEADRLAVSLKLVLKVVDRAQHERLARFYSKAGFVALVNHQRGDRAGLPFTMHREPRRGDGGAGG